MWDTCPGPCPQEAWALLATPRSPPPRKGGDDDVGPVNVPYGRGETVYCSLVVCRALDRVRECHPVCVASGRCLELEWSQYFHP